MSAGRLLLARHARTAGNAERRKMGRDDVPLDDVGTEQAAALAHATRDETIDIVFSSPLVRAFDTAQPIASARGLAVVVTDELLEMDFGAAGDEVEGADGKKLKVKERHRREPLPGGESLLDVWRRAGAFLDRVAPFLESGASVLAVTHYRAGQLLAGRALGLEFDAAVDDPVIRPRNASVFELARDDRLAGRAWTLVWSPEG